MASVPLSTFNGYKPLFLTATEAVNFAELHLTLRPLSVVTKTSTAQGWNRVKERTKMES